MYQLTAEQRADLAAHQPAMEAVRRLRAVRTHGLPATADQLHALTLMATRDRREADRARSEFLLAEMRAGRTPEV